MDEIVARHRKELRDLQSRVTQKKKQASKKTRKGVNDECDRLEAELNEQHAAEIAELNGHNQPDGGNDEDNDNNKQPLEAQLEALDVSSQDDGESANPQIAQEPQSTSKSTAAEIDASTAATTTTSSQSRKPNRQKARLARREADREEAARLAAEEADDLPDKKQQERTRMLSAMSAHKLTEKEIRADGHCLYSAVADQLSELGIPLGSGPADGGEKPELRYKITRGVAADYIEQHGDDFAGFLEEPLPEYVRKVRDTAEWGGQLELQALAKAYAVQINVLQDFGRVEKIEPDEGDGEGKASIWLGYYKHGFGLGEHYNSLRKTL